MGRYWTRRAFLKALGVIAFLGSLPGKAGAFFLSQFQTRTVERENFRFQPESGRVVWDGKREEPYHLLVDGEIETAARFSFQNLRGFAQITQTSDFHCVEGWSVADVRWGGFRISEILSRVKRKPGADYLLFHALGETEDRPKGLGHYRECYPLSELLDPKKECLLALDMDGKPLIHERGAPLRLVVPPDLGYKGIKYVSRLEFAKEQKPGWWTLANPIYPIQAPVPANRLRKKEK